MNMEGAYRALIQVERRAGYCRGQRVPRKPSVSLGLAVTGRESVLEEKHLSHNLGDGPSDKCQPNVYLAVAINVALKLSP